MGIDRRAFLLSGAGAAAAGSLPITLGSAPSLAGTTRLRVGSLKFGSLAWLLETAIDGGHDKANGGDDRADQYGLHGSCENCAPFG